MTTRSGRFRLWRSFGLTGVGAGIVGVDWPSGIVLVGISTALAFGLVFGYLPVFVAFLSLRSSLDTFTDVGVRLGNAILNVPAAGALFLVVFAVLHRVHTLIVGTPRRLEGLERLFLGWLLYLVVCVWFGARHFGDWGIGIREWTRLASIGAALYLSTSLAREGRSRWILRAIFFAIPIPLTVALWQWVTGSGQMLAGVERVSGTFFHPITLSVFMVLAMCLTLWRFLGSSHRAMWAVLLMLETVAMIAAYSLTALALVVVVAGILVLRLHGTSRLIAVAGAVVLLVTFALTSSGSGRLQELTHTGSIQTVIETNRSTNSLTWRVWHWWVLWQRSRPFRWTGAGLGTLEDYVSPIHYAAHNDAVRMLVEVGPVGLLLYMILCLRLLHVFRASEGSSDITGLWPFGRAFVFGLLIVSLFDNMNSATAVQYYVWAMAGALLGERGLSPSSELSGETASHAAQ